MDTSPDSMTRFSVPDTGVDNDRTSANPPSTTQEPIVVSSQPPQAPVPSVEQPEAMSPAQTRAPTSPLAVVSEEEIEHAYWAELEEDTSTPDEEEMKEIDGADADYSACDREFYPISRNMSQGLLTPWQTRIGRAISFEGWMTPNTSLEKRPV